MKYAAVAALILLTCSTRSFGQGALTPSSGPAPSFRTLTQVEPRTPINTLTNDSNASYIISIPGSYYLTDNLSGNTSKHGIRVDAVGVTIDLNGYLLEGVFGSQVGILITASGGPVTIRNGNLRFWSTGGIVALGNARVTVEDIDIGSTSAGPGVYLGNGCNVSRVRVSGSQRNGIRLGINSLARNCYVENFSATNWSFITPDTYAAGIKADTIVECTVRGFSLGGGSADGAYALYGDVVENCSVESINFQGLNASAIDARVVRGNHVLGVSSPGASEFYYVTGTIVEDNALIAETVDSVGISSDGYKSRIHGNVLIRNQIQVYGNSEVTENRVQIGHTNTAISASGTGNRIAGNVIEIGDASKGILVTGPGNIIRDNVISSGIISKGIRVESSGNLIRENNIRQAVNSIGIEVSTGAHNRIDENTVSGGAWGISIFGGTGAGTNNIITRNFVGGVFNGYITTGSNAQWPGVLVEDTIAVTNASAWMNFGQP